MLNLFYGTHIEFFLTTFDDLVKSPSAELHFILRHCGVAITTPHSSGLSRLA